MSTFEINATVRTETGKGASRRLRRENKVPGVIYGGAKNRKPASLTLELKELVKALENEAFYSQVLTVNVDGKEEQAVLIDLQRHPATDFPVHIDFERVTKSSVVRKRVPLHFLNEAPIVKAGNKVQHVATEVEVSCKIGDLPQFIEVDLAGLEPGQVVHLSELKLSKGITLVELNKGESHDMPVVSIMKPAGVSEDEDETTEEGDAE
ncbi:50S ribosomal protein L25/general stress protein Ctc [Reinekea marina]|uniref:Large ribosomal subunit protein bL25 n=1 Tax=Reinekea marina TaxID=1310421 RepID=A0ABV7WT69_9GAMM|nr:50S ribosomal protein L25/general stress protein Ctc [Reinekea marina]MBU2862632.1 50S ribosomal protein L25/general stress protein Ctc [Reinekea forsetii]MDN3648860.1 50S ribosomal protein L25/general stress protein Ctc [Reinekea marina]